MVKSPSIYVLRKNSEDLPSRDSLTPGDIVIMPSGDVLVYANSMWDLLPGRYEDVEQLKEFVSYVASGWPEDSIVARADMEGKVSPKFLNRMCETVDKLSNRGDKAEAT